MADGNDVVTDLLVRNLLELFNEKDGAIRRALLAELWSEDAIFIDPEAAHQGPEKIDKAIEWLAQCFPGFTFSVAGPVRSQHGVACLPWAYGPKEMPTRITGIDIGVAKQGRLAALFTFIDAKSA